MSQGRCDSLQNSNSQTLLPKTPSKFQIKRTGTQMSDDSMMGGTQLNYKTYSNNSAQHRQALMASSDDNSQGNASNGGGKKFSPVIVPQQQRTHSGNSSIENFLRKGS